MTSSTREEVDMIRNHAAALRPRLVLKGKGKSK
jgi:hypothetical protein